MHTFGEVLSAAKLLPPSDRMRLVEAIWEDVPPAEWPKPSPEWLAEVERRSAELDAGRMSTAPWSEVQARARKKAGLDE